MKTTYCDIDCCEAPAIERVSVSVKQAGDSVRNFCAGCLEAYLIGVQHGKKSAVAELRTKNVKMTSHDQIKLSLHRRKNPGAESRREVLISGIVFTGRWFTEFEPNPRQIGAWAAKIA